ncbi:CAF17-like 4Fe-4S cluster assembly/insertion protein YgfZ [Congregibacter sp.]|uniref:CAF17-like 4Fe-4S cluster assembly/insertion protein YgfZ n=1 Tax=Congregibacter sp. TaxID=2744308 RepID=UPI003F6D7D61
MENTRFFDAREYSRVAARVMIPRSSIQSKLDEQSGGILDRFACFLPAEAMIHLRGNKVPEFLQGQLTCDTRQLSPERAIMGALCNVKGRVLSDLTVVYISDSHLILRLRRSLAPTIARTLERYAQFSRISVELEASEHSIFALGGENFDVDDSGDDVRDASGPGSLPVASREGALFIRRSACHGELIAIDDNSARALAAQETVSPAASGNASANAPLSWELATLRAGHYALELNDLECFTPQALNYDLSGLVAFDKGCYTGQEIVARLHYKGRSKKRLQVLEGPKTLKQIARDTPLHSDSGQVVGSCLRCVSMRGSHPLIAGEVLSDHLQQTLYLDTGDRLDAVTPERQDS